MSSVKDSQLDELDAKFKAEPYYYMRLADGDRYTIIPVLLAGMERRPQQLFFGGSLFMITAADQRVLGKLTPDKKKAYSQYTLAYLQEAADINQTILKSDPNRESHEYPPAVFQAHLLSSIALTAVETGDLSLSKQISEELLKENKDPNSWNYGNVIHEANTILGRVALRQNDLEKARQYLIQAGKTPGSPQLNSFGPPFTLARELLEKGQKEAVLEYLDLVAVFWADPEKVKPRFKEGTQGKVLQLAKWKQEIREGKIPTDVQWQL